MQRFTQRANKAVWFFLAGSLRDANARRHLKWKLKQNINLSSKFKNSNFRSRYRIPFQRSSSLSIRRFWGKRGKMEAKKGES